MLSNVQMHVFWLEIFLVYILEYALCNLRAPSCVSHNWHEVMDGSRALPKAVSFTIFA